MQHESHEYAGFVSRKDVVRLARRLKREYGAGLSLKIFCRETGYPARIVLHLFDNWDKVRRTVGLAPLGKRTTRRLSDAEIRNLLIQHEAQRDGKLAKWEFCKLIGITGGELNSRFGTWFDLRESVGLPQRRVHRLVYTDEDIEQDMLQVYLRVGRCPGYHQWKLWGGKISPATLRGRFNTWKGVKIRFEIMRQEYHMRLDPTWTPRKQRTG